MRLYEGFVLICIAASFLIVGTIESNEPEQYYQMACECCHAPNLSTYQAYAQAWPSPAGVSK